MHAAGLLVAVLQLAPIAWAQDLPAQAARLREFLVHGSAGERDMAFAELLALGTAGERVIDGALREHGARIAAELRRSEMLRELRKLAELRRRLDRARAAALELIRDERGYRGRHYLPRHGRADVSDPVGHGPVDGCVRAIERIWERREVVHVSERFVERLEALDWNRERSLERWLAPASAGDLPAWLDGLGRIAGPVTVRTFAWSPAERAELERSLGEVIVRCTPGPGPQRSEGELIRVNAYRRMLGLPVLNWDPELASLAVDWLNGAAEGKPILSQLADRAILRAGAPPVRVLLNDEHECRNALDRWGHAADDHRLLLDPGMRTGACASDDGTLLLLLSKADSHPPDRSGAPAHR